MSDTVIRVEGLGKKYTIGRERNGSDGLRHKLNDFVSAPFRIFRNSQSEIRNPKSESFWALKDVSFEVKQGEVVGIIGRNGAGKSTLLKILSRITEPTEGRVRIRGRVASLLEVGTGFHPELTGRENVFLNGAILGMSREEIKRKFDEIVAFAEVEKFLDTPVKRYSSGMYVRLAFAVAAHLEPEILIVDEVLAVGDAQFQKKCLGKMGEVSKQGRTVLFVSHNMAAVSRLCSRAALLEAGELKIFAGVREVVSIYLSQGAHENLSWQPERLSGGAFHYHSVQITVETNGISEPFIAADARIQIVFDYSVSTVIPPGRLSFLLTNQEGTIVLTTSNTDHTDSSNQMWPIGRTISRCTIPEQLLAPGRYSLTISEPADDGSNVIHENIINFAISEQNSLAARDGRLGVIMPLLLWSQERKTNESAA
jgi:lipopolysaccharide transport system ATP-binding protein